MRNLFLIVSSLFVSAGCSMFGSANSIDCNLAQDPDSMACDTLNRELNSRREHAANDSDEWHSAVSVQKNFILDREAQRLIAESKSFFVTDERLSKIVKLAVGYRLTAAVEHFKRNHFILYRDAVLSEICQPRFRNVKEDVAKAATFRDAIAIRRRARAGRMEGGIVCEGWEQAVKEIDAMALGLFQEEAKRVESIADIDAMEFEVAQALAGLTPSSSLYEPLGQWLTVAMEATRK